MSFKSIDEWGIKMLKGRAKSLALMSWAGSEMDHDDLVSNGVLSTVLVVMLQMGNFKGFDPEEVRDSYKKAMKSMAKEEMDEAYIVLKACVALMEKIKTQGKDP